MRRWVEPLEKDFPRCGSSKLRSRMKLEFFRRISSAVDVDVAAVVCVGKTNICSYVTIMEHIIHILGRIKYYYHKIKLEHEFASLNNRLKHFGSKGKRHGDRRLECSRRGINYVPYQFYEAQSQSTFYNVPKKQGKDCGPYVNLMWMCSLFAVYAALLCTDFKVDTRRRRPPSHELQQERYSWHDEFLGIWHSHEIYYVCVCICTTNWIEMTDFMQILICWCCLLLMSYSCTHRVLLALR